MKTWLVSKHGDFAPTEEKPVPLSDGKVRVNVRYAGVGFADVMAVRGGYPLAPRRPFSPGYEFFGHDGQGTRVVGMLPVMGGYRRVLDLDPRWVVAVPDAVDDVTAATLPLNYLTALGLLTQKTRLAAVQSFVIHGAAGGVGSAVLELARLMQLKAYGTASPAKHDALRALGCIPLDGTGDWAAQLRSLEPAGVDAAFDSFGGDSLRRSWAALSRRGTLVSYGFSPTVDGGWAPMAAGLLWIGLKNLLPKGRRATVCGTPGLIAADPAWYRRSLQWLLELAAQGKIHPRLHAVLPWDRAEEAHHVITERRAQGKILLDFSTAG